MKILYRQPQKDAKDQTVHVPFQHFGIEKCYLKQILSDHDGANCIKSYHFHTGYEFHLIMQGRQTYEAAEGCYPIEAGHFLMVPPNKKHKIIGTAPHTCKYAITFSPNPENAVGFADASSGDCVSKKIPRELIDTIQYILSERELSFSSSELLIGNRVLESILLLFRAIGAGETKAQPPIGTADARIDLAKQFIRDNIQSPLQVSEVAAYCYVSPKQLTRLFYTFENTSPAIYIKKEKIRHIESLLADPTLSLREISDRMCFANEYYFNAFFKKYYGMPPGQYRKMLQ